MRNTNHHIAPYTLAFVAAVVISFSSFGVYAQENVFQLFQDRMAHADELYRKGSYSHALQAYTSSGSPGSQSTIIKIARCYYKLHDYRRAAEQFENVSSLDGEDRFMLAETYASLGEYAKAIEAYQSYLKEHKDDELVQNKIWRLRNAKFLYEDSAHFSIRKIEVNSAQKDFAAVPFEGGIVFVSNRPDASLFDRADALTGEYPFELFYAPVNLDPQTGLFNGYGSVKPFNGLSSKLHNGPVAFYDNDEKAAYVKSANKPGRNGQRTLQLFFAMRAGDTWKDIGAFPYNSADYNVSDPFVSPDGSKLFFTSDKKGGYGGKDIYVSEWNGKGWCAPQNLGAMVNTRLDETFPHFYGNELYFASNGHGGLGGVDIFKVSLADGKAGEVVNPGYPINTPADDFAFSFRRDKTGAYITSNRETGVDDLYEVEIGLQSYPLQISGILKSKDFALTDSAKISVLPETKMYLIDHSREIVVNEILTDESGHFQLTIPYFSQYKIKVSSSSGSEKIVSLNLPRQKQADYVYEIVVVKDAFHTPQE